MKKDIEGFVSNAEVGYEFFKRCLERNANTEAERVAILRELVAEKKALYLRDALTYMKNKKILFVRKKKHDL